MNTAEPDLQTLLRQGIAAAKAAEEEAQAASSQPLIRRLGAAQTSRRDQARQLLLRVTELDQTNIPAWLWLSTVLDSVEEKQICLENVLVLDPDNKAARIGLARLEQGSRPARPEAQATSPIQPPAGPEKAESPLQASTPTRQEKAAPKEEPGSGCPFCRKPISSVDSTCPHCRLPLVMNCPACGVTVDVEQKSCLQCGQAMGNYRQVLPYFSDLAAAYQEKQRFAEALRAWQAVKTLKPDYPDLLLRLVEVQLGLGRSDRATILLERALKQDPRSPAAHFAMGELFRQRGERREAANYYHKVTQLDPKYGLAWLRLGQLYTEARQPEDANQAYRRAAALLSADSGAGRQAQQQLELLRLDRPQITTTGWSELIRQMIGPMLVCILATLLDSGLRPWWIHWTGWLALFLAALGAFLCVSGASLPRNPLIRGLVGEQGIPSAELGMPLAVVGGLLWLLALGLILLPQAGQSLPVLPSL